MHADTVFIRRQTLETVLASLRSGDPDAARQAADQLLRDVAATRCADCGIPLSRYNPGRICQTCTRVAQVPAATRCALNLRGVPLIDGGRFAELRRNRGMTQEMLADHAHISRSLVAKVERNFVRSSSLGVLQAWADALGVPVTFLVDPAVAPWVIA
jgi:DNA-binding XRE family transcriptional regulator